MNHSSKKFKIALIGCGRISQSYIEALKLCDSIQLTAVMDIRKEAANSVAEMTGSKGYDDVATLIQNSPVDGAVLCAPPNIHRSLACQLMEHHISVLCEKPLAITLEDGLEMYETAKKNDVTLMMGSKFRYAEDIIRAKAMIESGMLGTIHFYENKFCSRVNMHHRWNANPQISGGGVIIDNAPHSVDIVKYLIGPIEKIYAHESRRTKDLPVEDTATISFITESNIMGIIQLSWTIKIPNETYIEIYGSEGALKIGWHESKYQYNGHPEWISFGLGYEKSLAFKNQLENFVKTVQEKEKPLITREDGLASIKLINAAYQSLNSGHWTSVKNQ